MTAEIAVMNKMGIALAADSAVSIATTDGTKVYNANKLFMLSKYRPVGLMIYGNAQLMGVPWETIVKGYRRQLGDKPYGKLTDYADDFLSYVSNSTFYFPQPGQALVVRDRLVSYLREMLGEIDNEVKIITQQGRKIKASEIRDIINSVIDGAFTFFQSLPDVPVFTKTIEHKIATKYSQIIGQTIKEVFQNLPLSRSATTKLKRICLDLLVKDTSDIFLDSSGIVIAGFGEDEIYPSLVSYSVEAVIDDHLKYLQLKNHQINGGGNDAAVIPFAQSEMVVNFMEGISPEYAVTLEKYLDFLFERYPDEIANKIPGLTGATHKAFVTTLKQIGKDIVKDFWDTINDWKKKNNIHLILGTVSVLPIDELASMAESLVNLTSFKRRVTLVPETVGGPIDVAVISKGDGLIWIKRKHYFDAKANPHFFSNYYK